LKSSCAPHLILPPLKGEEVRRRSFATLFAVLCFTLFTRIHVSSITSEFRFAFFQKRFGSFPLEAFGLTFTAIDVPGAIRTLAIGINARGDIAGWFQDPVGNIHGFLLSRGNFTTIDVPGAAGTTALGINAGGQIVGVYEAQGAEHGFDWSYINRSGHFGSKRNRRKYLKTE
jgi:uncharacterized membrane protein